MILRYGNKTANGVIKGNIIFNALGMLNSKKGLFKSMPDISCLYSLCKRNVLLLNHRWSVHLK